MMNYGDNVAKYVRQSPVAVIATAWTALRSGTSNLKGRSSIRLFPKSAPGMTIALAYAMKDVDGNFTTPTDYAGDCTIVQGGRTWTEPISDSVTVYGRLVKKGGETDNSVKLIVTEFN